MIIIETKNDLTNEINRLKKQNKTIGFVPTMGALHYGHITLVEQSCVENDITVVSIFVNPTQFNNPDDLEKYPRTIEQDINKLQHTNCSIVFAPKANEIYDSNEISKTFEYDFEGLDKVMEGKFRPGHFNGVVQVVEKLFRLVKPHKSYFGEKDFQQLAIIHQMVRKLKLDIEIVDCKIVREESGLAMSSRNERLTPTQRNDAAFISKVIFESKSMMQQYLPQELAEWMKDKINTQNNLSVEYVDIVNVNTLKKVKNWTKPTVVCVAVFCGKVRLIDNMRYSSL